MSCQRTGFLLSLPCRFIAGGSLLRRRFPSCAPQDISKCFVFPFNLFVLFFQTATKLLGQIAVKLFWPNCLIDGSAGYLYWPWGAVTKLLKHYGCREPRKFGNRCCTLYRLDERLCGSQSLRRRSSDKKTPTHAWNQILTRGTCNPWAIFLGYEVIYSHSM